MSKIFVYLDLVGPMLALPFYLSSNKKQQGHLLLLSFLFLQLIVNSIAKVLMLLHLENIYVYQLNAFFSCVIVSLFILRQLKNILPLKQISRLRVYAFASFVMLLGFIQWEDPSIFNGISYTFTAFTICVFSVIFYLQSLVNLKEENLIHSAAFWAITAFFFYYGISFFIFMYYKILTTYSITDIGVLWSIHNFVLFLSCLLLIISSKKS